jgi:hypothetical protein
MKPFVRVLLLLIVTGGLPALSQRPVPLNLTARDRATEQKITDLIARMTLAEKLGQLQQLDGKAELSSRTSRNGSEGLLGSTLNVRGQNDE